MTLSRRLVVVWAVGGAFLPACGQGSGVSIEIVAPEIASLDPTLDDRLQAIRLVDEGTNLPLAEQPFHKGDQAVTFSGLPIGFRGDLSLELLDGRGQILGMGRAAGVTFASGGGSGGGGRTLRFYVRYPLAYVGSSRGTRVVNTTWDLASAERVEWPLQPERVTSAAVFGDGRRVLVGTDAPAEVWEIDTSTDTATRSFALAGPGAVRRMVLDPTGQSVLLFRDQGFLPIVFPGDVPQPGDPMQLASTADATAAFAPGGDALYLVTGVARSGCGPRSLLQRRSPLGTDLSPPAPVLELPFSVSDLAVDPETGKPVVASPCTGQAVEIDPDTGAQVGAPLIDQLPGVTDVVVVRRALVAVGSHAGGPSGWELEAKVKLHGGEPEDIVIPWPEANIPRIDLDPSGETTTSFKPRGAVLRQVSVTPGLDQLVATVDLRYKDAACGGLDATVSGYAIASLLAAARSMTFTPTRQQGTGSCVVPGGDDPTAITVLFGAR